MAASGADGGGTVDLTAFTSLFQDMLSAGIAKATAPLYEKLGAMQHQIESLRSPPRWDLSRELARDLNPSASGAVATVCGCV